MEGMIARWYAKNTRQGREFDVLVHVNPSHFVESVHAVEIAMENIFVDECRFNAFSNDSILETLVSPR